MVDLGTNGEEKQLEVLLLKIFSWTLGDYPQVKTVKTKNAHGRGRVKKRALKVGFELRVTVLVLIEREGTATTT